MNPHISHSLPALLRHGRANLLVLFLTLGPSCQIPAAETTNTSSIGLKLLAEGLKAPIALAAIPDGSGRLFLADQAGVIYLLDRDGKKSEQPFLDLRPKLVGLSQGMEERGVLCIANDGWPGTVFVSSLPVAGHRVRRVPASSTATSPK